MTKWVVHHKQKRFDVYIGRPSKWGNPFVMGVHGTRSEVVDKHAKWLDGKIKAPDGSEPPSQEEIEDELSGKVLGCWCSEGQRCHGDNLSTRANKRPMSGLFKKGRK